MGSPQPIDGRCGSLLGDGTYCPAERAAGQRRCREHVAAYRGILGRFKHLTRQGREAVEEYIGDPSLLDHRRAVALHVLLMEQVDFEPSEQRVEALARARAIERAERRARGPLGEEARGKVQPTEGDREQVRRVMREAAEKAVLNHGKLVNAAARVEDTRAVMRAEALPIILDFAKAMARHMQRFVPSEHHAEFAAALRADLAVTLARLSRAEHELVLQARRIVSEADDG